MKTQKNSLDGTAVDPVFRGIPKNSTAFLIWRVQNLQLVPVPKEQYGVFYEGDSYVIFAASEHGKFVGPNIKNYEIRGRPEMHIHFWLGQATGQDESAVAAFKSVELDNYLGGSPVQHREVQGNESARFKAYFKNGVRIMLGGVATALKPTNNNFEPRLFKVKGRKRPLVYQMPAVAWEYFNSGDVFIIDTKDVVFVWIGRTSNSMERLQATKVATQLRDERNALSIVFVDDGKEMELPGPEQTLLGFYLDLRPLAKRVMAEASGDDRKEEKEVRSAPRLYRCSDSDGIYKVTEVKTGALDQTDLDSRDSYIIDNGPYHVWVWIGKDASSKERIEAMRNANGFLKKKNYPVNCRVSRVVDGGEPAEFKVLFTSWKDRETNQTSKLNGKGTIPKNSSTNMKNLKLQKNNHLLHSAENGAGSFTVWRVTKGSLEEVHNKYVLYSAEIFYIQYKYTDTDGHHREVLYNWLGKDSKEDTQTILTLSQEEVIKTAKVKIRIVEKHEPPHFLAAFKGKLVVLEGGYQERLPKTYLLQIQGNQAHNTYGCQKELKRSSLHADYVYLLKTDPESYIWCGKGSTGDEREMAKSLARTLIEGEYSVLFEGQEKSDFLKLLPGEEIGHSLKKATLPTSTPAARLFQCSYANSVLRVEEIMDFTQNDLASEDICILDDFYSLCIWVGNNAKRDERSKILEMAFDYLNTDSSRKDANIPIIHIKQGYEPTLFTLYFENWDPNMWMKEKKFEQVREELDKQKPTLQVDLIVADNLPNFYECEKYPLKVLVEKDPEKLPIGVDVQHKEMYLSSEEFFDVFSMKFSEFSQIPKWKQDYLKKNVGLF